ncbi:YMGG-like glycine zipper-containing protein [Pararhizobium haloflavum]|uniref:YMGG-like glycine zipper-containing protein n=1 Tax=Pararhizobium haloflavum TaxID=2037914 RepID=UPI000C17A4EC|nr:glycine zipper domain-containing protein [Pararhizobium haloflavum]
MKKIVAVLIVMAAAAGCTPTEEGAVIGAVSGGAVGAAVGDTEGALIGAAVGGAAGALIGRASENPGQCYYRDNYGRRYIASCPRGY